MYPGLVSAHCHFTVMDSVCRKSVGTKSMDDDKPHSNFSKKKKHKFIVREWLGSKRLGSQRISF
jgi:hypothetical protein